MLIQRTASIIPIFQLPAPCISLGYSGHIWYPCVVSEPLLSRSWKRWVSRVKQGTNKVNSLLWIGKFMREKKKKPHRYLGPRIWVAGWESQSFFRPIYSLEKNNCFRIFSWRSLRREVLRSWGSGTVHISHMLVVRRSAIDILLIPTKRKECSALKAQHLWRTGCWSPGNANECNTWTSLNFQ